MKKRDVVVNALKEVINRRLQTVNHTPAQDQTVQIPSSNIEVKAPQIHNHVDVPVVHNHVDIPAPNVVNEIAAPSMDPIAAALDRFTIAIEHQAEMISQLIQVIAGASPPVVQMPHMDVEALASAIVVGLTARQKKKATIKHSKEAGGGTSTVTLE